MKIYSLYVISSWIYTYVVSDNLIKKEYEKVEGNIKFSLLEKLFFPLPIPTLIMNYWIEMPIYIKLSVLYLVIVLIVFIYKKIIPIFLHPAPLDTLSLNDFEVPKKTNVDELSEKEKREHKQLSIENPLIEEEKPLELKQPTVFDIAVEKANKEMRAIFIPNSTKQLHYVRGFDFADWLRLTKSQFHISKKRTKLTPLIATFENQGAALENVQAQILIFSVMRLMQLR